MYILTTHIFLKVLQTKFIGFVEKLSSVHATSIQDDICSLWDPVAIYDII